ncbi:MAG: hypothetical protein SFT94_00650 [Pseudanabaenaceae cyanobacterium bins.68]|nr:hypothetical protein [Pseudanabaenaceae cyanobacterium bins.68]
MKQDLLQQPTTIKATEEKQSSKKILLGQLSSNGDCLYVTAIAHQIKKDYPECHLTWAIGSIYRSVLDLNPHVDEVWEIPLIDPKDIGIAWKIFNNELENRQKRGEFDEIFITQMQAVRFDGTIRSSTFSGYPKPITISVSPVLRLHFQEVENVRRFAESHQLPARDNTILVECSAKSEQSFITPDFALELARMIVDRFQNYCVILSSNIAIISNHERIIDGSVLTFRENAELTKYCSFLIGGSSGITWISTSDWAKSLPMIQLINPDALWFASVTYDHEYWGLPTDNIIEMIPCSAEKVFTCFKIVFEQDFQIAKSKFHTRVLPNFKGYQQFQYEFMVTYQFRNVYRISQCTINRNGLNLKIIFYILLNLLMFVAKKLIPPILIDAIKFTRQLFKKL